MVVTACSNFSCFPSILSSSIEHRRSYQIHLSGRSFGGNQYIVKQMSFSEVLSCQFTLRMLKVRKKFQRRQFIITACDFDFVDDQAIEADAVVEPEEYPLEAESAEAVSPESSSYALPEENGGKPGFVSFSNYLPREELVLSSDTRKNQSSMLWIIGPAVLVASFVFPSLYLRRILSTIFEDSLLTDFLILFFTEALFYCGVAVFIFLTDYLWRPIRMSSAVTYNARSTLLLGHRISSVAVLILSLIIPMVTMGFVWPWTGPAASAALAPYLVGIVVQFAFEQYARYLKSPSWPVIPIIFQVYRLNQLNRAAQLVTALSRIEKVRLNRKDGISKVVGTLLCVAGASVITLYKGPTIYSPTPPLQHSNSLFPSLGDASGKNWTLGCIFLIGHCLSWSGWLVLQAPVLKKYPARLSVTSYTCFFGVIQFLIIAAFLETDLDAWRFHSGGEVFTVLYAGVVASGIAFAVQIWCIDRGGPVFVAVYQPVQTLVVAIMASITLGEEFYLGGIIGAILIIAGLYLVLWGKSAEAKFTAMEKAAIQPQAEHGSSRGPSHKLSLTQPLLPTENV